MLSILTEIEDWFDSLERDQIKAVAKEVRLLELCGNQLKLPHSRALGNGLFELREQRFGLRIYYCFLPNEIFLLLCGGHKDSQQKDIDKARRLLKKHHIGVA